MGSVNSHKAREPGRPALYFTKESFLVNRVSLNAGIARERAMLFLPESNTGVKKNK